MLTSARSVQLHHGCASPARCQPCVNFIPLALDSRRSPCETQLGKDDEMECTGTENKGAMESKARNLSAVEQNGTLVQLDVSQATADEETETGSVDVCDASPCDSGRIEQGVSAPMATPSFGEGRMTRHTSRVVTESDNWRERHDRKSAIKEDLHKNSFQSKEDTKKFDRRRPGCAPPLPPHRDEVEQALFNGIRCAKEDPGKLDAAASPLCYVKMLISNQLAGMVIGNTGQEVKRLKEVTGAKIVLSSHGTYFPGTSERLVSAEGSERSVFQVIDWLIDRMHELAKAKVAGSEEKKLHFKAAGKTRGGQVGAGTADASELGKIAAPTVDMASPTNLPLSICPIPLTCKLCVPRAVVGSLIGRKGGYIQSVRVATEANINISPLFVTADEACAERIITIESPRLQSLRTATFTLARKINSHPEKATCKHMCYYRKLSFEPSPLALLEESRRDRTSCRFAATEVRVSQLREAAAGEGAVTELSTCRTAELLRRHSGHSDDASNERDVSYLSASTATSATKASLPFKSLLRHSSLSRIGGATGGASSRLSSAGMAATTTTLESSSDATIITAYSKGENLPIPLEDGFFNGRAQADAVRVVESVAYAASPTAACAPCSLIGRMDQAVRKTEPSSHQDGTHVKQHDGASEDNTGGPHEVITYVVSPGGDKILTFSTDRHPDCRELTVAKEEGVSGRWRANNAGTGHTHTCSLQVGEDLGRYPSSVNVHSEPYHTTVKVGDTNNTLGYPGIHREGCMVTDDAPYATCALSHESLTPICSTAAGSIATLTSILQGIHEDMPDQQLGGGRGATASSEAHDLQFTKIASQEASSVAAQLRRNSHLEQRGISVPEDLLSRNTLPTLPSLASKSIASTTEPAAAAPQFGSVGQSCAATASAYASIPPVAKRAAGLNPTAAEFMPSKSLLHYPLPQTSTDGGLYNSAAMPSMQDVRKIPEGSTRGQTQTDGLQKHQDLEVAAGAASEVETTVMHINDNDGPSSNKTPQSPRTKNGAYIQRAPVDLGLTAMISSAVTRATREKDVRSELALVVNSLRKAGPTGKHSQVALSTRHSSVEEPKLQAEDGQRSCDTSRTKPTAGEDDKEKRDGSNSALVSTSYTPSDSIRVLLRLTSWIPCLLDCSFPAFMMFWTTALVVGVLLSFVFTHVGNL